MNSEKKIMRDALIEEIYRRMADDNRIFFVTADFGAPKLDKLREDFKDRFINVGIAEQNLINVSTGLALEGFTVYAYAIAPFLVMRAYEQIRNNLSLLSHTHNINVNLIGVGVGLSYDVSGPTHHTFEDIGIIRALPHMMVFSPSDWVLAEKFVDYSLNHKSPKYIRLDGKPLPNIYDTESGLSACPQAESFKGSGSPNGFGLGTGRNIKDVDLQKGFFELAHGEGICLVSTGYMTHTALKVIDRLKKEQINIGLVDVFLIKPLDAGALFETLSGYNHVITLEEAYINKGGLDSLVSNILEDKESDIKLRRMGFGDVYVFDLGSRAYLHKKNNLDEDSVINNVKDILARVGK